MGFHMSPSHEKVQKLFKGHQPLLARPRIPIAERARRVAAARKITTAEAGMYTARERFRLATNHFTIFDVDSTDFMDDPGLPFSMRQMLEQFYGGRLPSLTAQSPLPGDPELQTRFKTLVLSHVGSNLRDAHVGIWFFLNNCEPSVKIYAANESYPFERGCAEFSLNDKLTLFLEIRWSHPDRLSLFDIKIGPRENDLGGKTLAAVYNITSALGLRRIDFFTYTDDRDAQRFYFHTDFGRTDFKPTPLTYEWQVNVA